MKCLALSFVTWACFCGNLIAQIDTTKLSFDTLANGLRVGIYYDSLLETTAIQLAFQAGSRYDRKDRAGVAYLAHHLLYNPRSANSADLMPGENINYLTKGVFDHQINHDLSRYRQLILPQAIDLALKIEAKRLDLRQYSNEYINEWRAVMVAKEASRKGNKDEWARQLLQYWYYPPVNEPLMGVSDLVESTSNDEIRTFLNTYYLANRASLIIAGPHPADTIAPMIKQYFTFWPGDTTDFKKISNDTLNNSFPDTLLASDTPLNSLILKYRLCPLDTLSENMQWRLHQMLFHPEEGLVNQKLKALDCRIEKVFLEQDRVGDQQMLKTLYLFTDQIHPDSVLVNIDTALYQIRSEFLADTTDIDIPVLELPEFERDLTTNIPSFVSHITEKLTNQLQYNALSPQPTKNEESPISIHPQIFVQMLDQCFGKDNGLFLRFVSNPERTTN